jgi:4-hydroxybenzoate polyprenyltransferase/phosphoserine phosphatase
VDDDTAASLAAPIVEILAAPTPLPLILDLDGTLLAADLLVETFVLYIRRNPLRAFIVLLWLLRGPAHLKARLAEATRLDVDSLPAREDVVALARAHAAAGGRVFVYTAAHGALAARLLERFDFLEDVVGSDGAVNLKGARKAAAMAARFPNGFVYVGDSAADLPVWAIAAEAVFAGHSGRVLHRLRRLGVATRVTSPPPAGLRDWAAAFRPHQWAKNTLVFVPLALGGALGDVRAWGACAGGFLAMNMLASGSYVLNDILDLADDRAHWSKSARPFAAGRLSILAGLVAAPAAIVGGLAVGRLTGGAAPAAMLALYLATTLAYSFGLKRTPILDLAVIASLFTLRLALGVTCAHVTWSPWLLVFSMLAFSSLSGAKRFTELARLRARGGDRLAGRGYRADDAPFLLALGVSLSVAAVLVMVLYLIEEAFRADLYRTPQLLWALPVGLALWFSRVWLLCGRGELHDDPVAFAVRDRISLVLGGVLGAFTLAAVLL